VILNNSGELLIFANEYEPVTGWKLERYPNPFGATMETRMLERLVPEGGKQYFRIYKIPKVY
jgi:hypothetical protein